VLPHRHSFGGDIMCAVANMTADEIRVALAEAGARRKRAMKAEIEARADILDLLRRGEGVVPMVEMQRLSGMARSVIYRALDGGRTKREVEALRAELQAAREQIAALQD
jgi:hypothetical protein